MKVKDVQEKQIGIKRRARKLFYSILSRRTWTLLKFDLLRLRARAKRVFESDVTPAHRKLHFGCGKRRVDGWLNVDVAGSDYDVDLASGPLPWKDGAFEAIVSQQVVEHLEIQHQLIPLFEELSRVSTGGAEIWLACPDMETVCRSYFEHGGEDLLKDRQSRWPDFSIDAPSQQMVNVLFHQGGEHKNLYDFDLLRWALERGGFTDCERVNEADFYERFPEFPERGDDYSSLYVRAWAK